ncbi:hypothetical protein [Streptosporangium canum]|uniref:hypothetical protein n=1 Tax=Streptosporangium canum TaxID=324952 RepID=UPI0033BDC3B1
MLITLRWQQLSSAAVEVTWTLPDARPAGGDRVAGDAELQGVPDRRPGEAVSALT